MEYERAKPKLARHGEPMELETALLESKISSGKKEAHVVYVLHHKNYAMFTKEHLVLF